MNEFTINCFYNNKECEELVWDYKEQNQVLEIRCDNVIDNNSFIMEYYGDEGILITRNRCELIVYLTENKTYYDRNYTIICTHANNAEVFVQINITQEAEKFALDVKIEEWIPNKQYYCGDRVFYDGSIWSCKVDNTDQTEFSKKYFEKIEEIEEWIPNKQYYKGDRVFYDGSIWRCIENNTGQVVFSDKYFGEDDTVTLQSIVDSSNSSKYSGGKMYYEEQTINLNIVGGSKKYRVVGIYKCYDEVEFEEWTADTQYYKDDRVFYDGSIWSCKVDNKEAEFNADNFEKVEEIEKWKSNQEYSKGDRVFYKGNIWCCIENNTGQVVFSEKYFEKEGNTVHRTTFDNGFILKKNTNSIVIRNYGRPFINEKYYYIIVLEHFDVRDIKKEIIIKYTSLENSTITKKLRKNIELKSSKPKIIMPIIQEEKQEKEDIVEIKPIEYGLEMLENVEDYTIIGEPVETILPFTVTEDGIESNLMVKASSSAYWCRVKVIQEYNDNDEIERKLIFRITNKPLIIRKTRITVSIIDLPDVNVSFIITNKPS